MTEVASEANKNDELAHAVRPVPRRLRAAELVAFLGLVAAFVAALGPAQEVRTTYAWPPKTLPQGEPSRLWYTPLLLAARIPEHVSVRIPCTTAAPLEKSERPITILASARSPEQTGGFLVTRDAAALSVKIGDAVLARTRVPTDPAPGDKCSYDLDFEGGTWSLHGGPTNSALGGGHLQQMPVVNGLFSELDLKSGPVPRAEVTTMTHQSRTLARQALGWAIAVMCALTALILVASGGSAQPGGARVQRRTRRLVANVAAVDAFIGVALVGWWILAPAFFDDGWTIARQRAFQTTGGFSNYYDSFGVSLPLGYWLEWTQQWLTRSTDALLVLRLPALLCLAAAWVLCRLIFGRIVHSEGMTRSTALWALAIAFLTATMAWGMSLRQEPAVALLTAGVLACFVWFLETRSRAPLAAVAVLIPLAITAHPAGVVALAPIVALAPTLISWARSQPAAAVATFIAAAALALVLGFVGSDVNQRARDAQTIGAVSTTVLGWQEEPTRYSALSSASEAEATGAGYGTPLRRASVALIPLALLGFLTRRRRERRALLDLPSLTLTAALVLLIATPSKWPWHFGALIPFIAVAVAAEALRLRAESSGGRVRPLIVVGATILAIAWAWSLRAHWNTVDLRSLDWTPAFEAVLPLSAVAAALPIALATTLVVIAHRRRRSSSDDLSRVATWSAALLALPLIAFTTLILTMDAVRTESWTSPRHGLDALTGEDGCGLGAELLVPSYASVRSLRPTRSRTSAREPAWMPPPPVRGLPRFALGPTVDSAFPTPWFMVPPTRRLGLFIAGSPAPSDRLSVEWATMNNGRASVVRADAVAIPGTPAGSIIPWRFISAGEIGTPPNQATAVRIVLHNDSSPGAAIAVTAPVSYRTESLEQRLARNSLAFALSNVVTFFPCMELPRLADGTVAVPGTVITTLDVSSPVRYAESSPFAGLLDLYDLERLPLGDSPNAPTTLVVFGVNSRIPGAVIAAPERTTVVS